MCTHNINSAHNKYIGMRVIPIPVTYIYLYFIIVLYIIQIIEYDYTRLLSVPWEYLSVESPSPKDPATPPGQSEGPPGRQWLSQGSAREFVKK